MVNTSKVRDQRCWDLWRRSGAVGTVTQRNGIGATRIPVAFLIVPPRAIDESTKAGRLELCLSMDVAFLAQAIQGYSQGRETVSQMDYIRAARYTRVFAQYLLAARQVAPSIIDGVLESGKINQCLFGFIQSGGPFRAALAAHDLSLPKGELPMLEAQAMTRGITMCKAFLNSEIS